MWDSRTLATSLYLWQEVPIAPMTADSLRTPLAPLTPLTPLSYPVPSPALTPPATLPTIEASAPMSISALIIDDEQLAREELKYLLDSVGGVDVLAQGSNGIEAIDLIDEHHPDLVFLDVQMPGQDGFAVIQRLVDRA